MCRRGAWWAAIRRKTSASGGASPHTGWTGASGWRIERVTALKPTPADIPASTQRVAVVDPGSFVLPYDYQLVKSLARRGQGVDFYGSRTRYNAEFLEAMPALPGVAVRAASISSTVAPRWRGALAYVGLLLKLVWNSRRYSAVNRQFSGFWPAEWLVMR